MAVFCYPGLQIVFPVICPRPSGVYTRELRASIEYACRHFGRPQKKGDLISEISFSIIFLKVSC